MSEQDEQPAKPYTEAHGLVRNFLTRLPFPDRLPCPSVVVEQDGDLGFDWDERKDAVVSASICPDGAVHWAALIDGWKATGRFTLPGWADDFNEAMTRLGTALEMPLPPPPPRTEETPR